MKEEENMNFLFAMVPEDNLKNNYVVVSTKNNFFENEVLKKVMKKM